MPFVIDVDPVAFSLGPLAVRWYGITLAVAIAVAYAIANREAARLRLQPGSFRTAPSGLASRPSSGAACSSSPRTVSPTSQPTRHTSSWCGWAACRSTAASRPDLIALVVFARRRGVPWRIAVDVAAPAAAIGQAIGHIGCLIGGDSAGIATGRAVGRRVPKPRAMAQLGVPLHPTQAYEAIALAALFVVLWSVRRRLTPIPGRWRRCTSVASPVTRFLLFFLRDEAPALLGLKTAQWIGVGILVAAAWILLSPPCAWPVSSARHPRYRRALAHDRAHESIQCPRCAHAASSMAPSGPRGRRDRHRPGCRGLPARRPLVLYVFSMGAMLLMHAGGHGGHGSGHADHEARSAQDGDDSPAEAGNEGHKGGGCH